MHHIHFHMKKWQSFVKETRLPYTCVHFLFKGFCRLLIHCVQRIVVKVCLSSWIIYENGVSIKFSTCQRQCVLKLYDISVQALPFASIHMTHKFKYSFIFPPLSHWVFYTVCMCGACPNFKNWKIRLLASKHAIPFHHTLTSRYFSSNHTHTRICIYGERAKANRIFNLHHIYRCIKH